MSDQDPNPKSSSRNKSSNTASSSTESAFGSLVDMFNHYRPVVWNILLLVLGMYLVWVTYAVLFNIIGFCIGAFLVFFALTELRLFDYQRVLAFVLRLLRRR